MENNVESINSRGGTSKICIQIGKGTFKEFCEDTSVHGIKYLGDNRKGIPEKLCWLAIIITSSCFCLKLIWNSYQKWENYPVVTTFATSPTDIWQIPFPAITICPEVKTMRSTFNFTDAHLKLSNNIQLTAEEQNYYNYLSLVCERREPNITVFQNRQQVYNSLIKMAPKLKETVFFSFWSDRLGVKKYFKQIITSVGICYTFNILDESEIFRYTTQSPSLIRKKYPNVNTTSQWTMEDGYYNHNLYGHHGNTDVTNNNSGNSYYETYPLRTWNAGINGGIEIGLATFQKDLDYTCNDPMHGYKVALHNPGELPRMREKYFQISLDEHVNVAIKPKMTTASKALEDYDPEQKQCFFEKDKPLAYYRIYTQQNCINECLANFTEAVCGCIEFHMPGRNSTPICGPRKMSCVKEVAEYALFNKRGITRNNPQFDGISCYCLPPCISLDFDMELSQAKSNWNKMLTVPNKFGMVFEKSRVEGLHISWLVLYMKEEQFMSLERQELYGSTDFWANCGGLLGLCMGVSIFSVLEVIYFCTLRVCCSLKESKTNQTSKRDLNELIECVAIK